VTDIQNSTDRWLASENIKNYEKKFQETQDENGRGVLRRLIEEEHNTLGKLDQSDWRRK
jgi:hypothetical protein